MHFYSVNLATWVKTDKIDGSVNIMKFKDLIKKYSWQDIKGTLFNIYKESDIGNPEGYFCVYNRLQKIECQETDIILYIEQEIDNESNKTYYDIFGKRPNDEDSFALEFTPWSKWLNFEISEEALNQFSELAIISHCLYEMTFCGFDEKIIQNKVKEIRNNAKKSLKEFKKRGKTTLSKI